MNKPTVPVLYLFDNVFYPETIIPLVLSDEPSKNLIRQAFSDENSVALLSNHPKSKGIATLGKIVMLDEKRIDGKVTAIIVGTERVMLTKLVQHLPYPVFEHMPYQDQRETHVLVPGALERLHHTFENWVNKHVHSMEDREVFLKDINSPRKLLFNISLFMVKDIELKILFLESTSIVDRLNLLNALFPNENLESEDESIAEAIKNFDRLEPNYDIAN